MPYVGRRRDRRRISLPRRRTKPPLVTREQTDRTKIKVGIPHVAEIERERITKKTPKNVPPSVKRRMLA